MMLLPAFLLVAVFLLASWFVGAIAFFLCGIPRGLTFAAFFFRVFAGSCLITVGYAVILSGGKTSLLLMAIPGIVLWWCRKQPRTGSFFGELKLPMKWLGLSLLVLGLLLFFLQYFFESVTMQQDSANYLKMAEAMRLTGQENTRHFRNLYSTLFHGVEPYHYFEMWLAALFMDFSAGIVSHLQCLRLCSYGFILGMCASGLIAICETIHGKVKVLHVVVSLLFLFFIPNVAQLFFNYEHHFSYPLECNPVNRINFRTYWMFLIPSFIFFIRKEYLLGVITLLLLPLVSVTTAPAVLGTIALLVLVNVRSRFFDRKQLWLICVSVLIMVVGIVLLFALFKIKGIKPLYSFSLADILAYFKASWKAVLHAVFMESLNVLVVAAPFILSLLLLNRGKEKLKLFAGENRFIIFFLFLMLATGILFFQVTSFMNNAYQFVFIAYCVLALTIFVLIQKTCADILSPFSGTTVQLLMILFLVFSGIRLVGISRHSLFYGQELYKKEFKPYSRDYLSQVNDCMKLIGKAPGGYIGDSSYYDGLYYSKRLPDFYFPGLSYFIFAGTDDSYQFCLSDTSAITFGYQGTQRDMNFLRQAVSGSLFYEDFYSKQNSMTVGEKRKEAIVRYKLAYLILTPGAKVDEAWRSYISEEIMDKTTGERFLVLK